MSPSTPPMTDRQIREIQYHKGHAAKAEAEGRSVAFDVIGRGRRRWWNASWAMYTHLMNADLRGKKVLVAGCGFGEDAIRLAKLGACVYAFDLSPDVLKIARRTAETMQLAIDFAQQPMEHLDYPAGVFDCIVARDILHHVSIAPAMSEMARVARPGAMFVANEVYSHSFTHKLRNSRFVNRVLYPRMVDYIYEGDTPYITPDERKLDERDIRKISAHLADSRSQYFSFIVSRLVPARYAPMAKIDRLFLRLLGGAGGALAGRILLTGRMR